jgi:NAD(P)-dependent dehydrogenase (short-subunit alcohol dehydrogenase family)
MQLRNKNAIIYGAGGAIGSAVARAFASEGAKVFLAGHSKASLIPVYEEIIHSGGQAEMEILDATNEHEVNKHFRQSLESAGKIDISFNAIGIPQTGVQGIPLLDLSPEAFTDPIHIYATSNFLTARAAGRHMAETGSGVILTVTAPPSRLATPNMGGMPASWSVIESLTRTFAGELGRLGVRVVCLRPDGLPESDTITEVYGLHAQVLGMPSNLEFQSVMEGVTLLKRLPKLKELADTAVFIASDKASAITATVINLSCGALVD